MADFSIQVSLILAAMNSLPTGAFICDKDGIVQFINEAYANYLQLKQEDAIGKYITEIIPDSKITAVLKSGKAELRQVRRFPGRSANLIVNRVPLFENGELIGALSMALFDTAEQVQDLLKEVRLLDNRVDACQRRVKSALSSQYTIDSIIGSSKSIIEFKTLLQRYAVSDAAVFLYGATGSGKELAAGAIHTASLRAGGPFVPINCAAIPKELFESEVFGYASGAFSGARREGNIGKVEMAHQGTLFLDEVGELSLQAQAKLLRVLEEKSIFRVGSSRQRQVDFRLIAASNRDLRAMVEAGNFREDLYYRINALPLRVPPLRERKEDIPLLVGYFLAHMGAGDTICSDEAMDMLCAYPWPGNVRELRNAVGHALCLSRNGRIEPQDLPPECRILEWRNAGDSLQTITRNAEGQAIEKALRETGGNKSKAARLLGVSRAAFYEKLKKVKKIEGK